MTNKELSQIYYIKKEIELTEKRIVELKKNKQDIETIQELEKSLHFLKNDLYKEMTAIQKYINNVEDSLVRMIITLRCVECYSWDEVAIAIGGGNSYEGLKKIYYRYIKSN